MVIYLTDYQILEEILKSIIIIARKNKVQNTYIILFNCIMCNNLYFRIFKKNYNLYLTIIYMFYVLEY